MPHLLLDFKKKKKEKLNSKKQKKGTNQINCEDKKTEHTHLPMNSIPASLPTTHCSHLYVHGRINFPEFDAQALFDTRINTKYNISSRYTYLRMVFWRYGVDRSPCPYLAQAPLMLMVAQRTANSTLFYQNLLICSAAHVLTLNPRCFVRPCVLRDSCEAIRASSSSLCMHMVALVSSESTYRTGIVQHQ